MNNKEISKLSKKTRVINIGNEKGGVGKTSLTRLLPAALANLYGFKSLIIDMDPQANTTKSLYVTRNIYHEDEVTVFENTLMNGIAKGDLSDLILNVMPNVDFIPSAYDLKSFPTFLGKKFGLVDESDPQYFQVKEQQYSYFKTLIDQIKEGYDFIFFDTPPTSSDITEAVSYSSDYVLIAFQTQSDSLDGARNFLEQTLIPLSENFDTHFEIIGILPNQMTKGSIESATLNDAHELFGSDNVFENIVPFTKAIQNIPRNGVTLQGYWNSKMFNESINPIAEELINRIIIVEE